VYLGALRRVCKYAVSIRAEWPSLAAIAGVFIAGCAVVHPLRDAPVIDDWVYAWSVEHLLRTGELRVLDISAIYPLAQILWGALFAQIAGFSFGILRLSTVVLALLGCGALHLTLRELGFSRAMSLLGALTMALDPVFFAMSFSFMTDASFVSVAIMALFATSAPSVGAERTDSGSGACSRSRRFSSALLGLSFRSPWCPRSCGHETGR
jgi:hypothetical protein